MEKLQENLLKNGWVKALDAPPLTHGDMLAAHLSTSNLDNFESKTFSPISRFEENKDANSDNIEEILAMMSSEKRIPPSDKVMVDATNVRGKLLNRGRYAVPVARRDAFEASVLPMNQKENYGKPVNKINGQLEPEDDTEILLNLMSSKKEPKKAAKCQGSEEMVNINEALLKLGWRMKNEEPTATGGDFSPVTPVADKMTNLVEKWFQHFEDKKTQNIQTKATEDPITINKDVEKILDMLSSKKVPLQANPSQGSEDKVNIREPLIKLGWRIKNEQPTATETPVSDKMTDLVDKWFQHFEDKKPQNIQTKETEDPITINKDVEKILDMLSSKKVPLQANPSQGKMDKPKRDGYRESLVANGWYAIPNHKLPEPEANTAVPDKPGSELKNTPVQKSIELLNRDATQPDYIENILNVVRMKTPLAVVANSKGAVDTVQLRKSLLSKGWYTTENDSINLESKNVNTSPEQLNLPEEFSRTSDEKELNSDKPRHPKGNGCHGINMNFDDVTTESHDISHKKKTLFRRFVRRSRNLMGRFFACGKKEEA